MKIHSAVPENGCLIFMHYRGGREKTKKRCKTHTHPRPLAAADALKRRKRGERGRRRRRRIRKWRRRWKRRIIFAVIRNPSGSINLYSNDL